MHFSLNGSCKPHVVNMKAKYNSWLHDQSLKYLSLVYINYFFKYTKKAGLLNPNLREGWLTTAPLYPPYIRNWSLLSLKCSVLTDFRFTFQILGTNLVMANPQISTSTCKMYVCVSTCTTKELSLRRTSTVFEVHRLHHDCHSPYTPQRLPGGWPCPANGRNLNNGKG